MSTGPGSINADSYDVGGETILMKATYPAAIIFSLGQSGEQAISDDAISFVASNMLISPHGGVADDLTTISGGTPGALLLIRKSAGGGNVTVKDGTSIKCGSDRVLTNNLSMVLICIQANVWSCAS